MNISQHDKPHDSRAVANYFLEEYFKAQAIKNGIKHNLDQTILSCYILQLVIEYNISEVYNAESKYQKSCL